MSIEVATDKGVAVVGSDAVLQVAQKYKESCIIGVWPGGPVARVDAEISRLDPCESRLRGPDDVD